MHRFWRMENDLLEGLLVSILQQMHKNDTMTVVYFCKGEYLKLTGMVSRINDALSQNLISK